MVGSRRRWGCVVVVRAPTNPRTVFDPIQTALPSPPPRRCRHAALHNVPERCSPALSLPVQAVLAAMGLGAGSVGAARGDGRGGPGQSPEPGMVIMLDYHKTGHNLLPMLIDLLEDHDIVRHPQPLHTRAPLADIHSS